MSPAVPVPAVFTFLSLFLLTWASAPLFPLKCHFRVLNPPPTEQEMTFRAWASSQALALAPSLGPGSSHIIKSYDSENWPLCSATISLSQLVALLQCSFQSCLHFPGCSPGCCFCGYTPGSLTSSCPSDFPQNLNGPCAWQRKPNRPSWTGGSLRL